METRAGTPRIFTPEGNDKISCDQNCQGKNAFLHLGDKVCGAIRALAKNGYQIDKRSITAEMRICTMPDPEK